MTSCTAPLTTGQVPTTQVITDITQQTLPAVDTLVANTTELATSLAQIKRSTSRPRSNTASLLNQIERLTSSLARLIEAIAKLKDSMSPRTNGSSTTAASSATSNNSSLTQDQGTTDAALDPTSTNATVNTVDNSDTTADTTPVTSDSIVPSPLEQTDTASTALALPPKDVSILPLPTTPVPKKPISLGSSVARSGEFLWKPVSDKDGKLAILLPSSYTGKVKSVKIMNAKGSRTLQKGTYSGVGNGDREHFRFSKPGSSFPDGAIVLITMKDGSTRHITIKDTAKRTTV